MLKKLKGNRTRIFNVVGSLPLILETVGMIANQPEIRGIIPMHWLPAYGLVLTVGNIILRQMTTTPAGKVY